MQWPIAEIEKLHGHQVDLPQQVLKGGLSLEISGVTAAQVRFCFFFSFFFFGVNYILSIQFDFIPLNIGLVQFNLVP